MTLCLRSYWCRYWIGAWFELPVYAARRKRFDWAARTVRSELLYWAVLALLWRVNHVATLWCFIIPFFLSSFLFMFGNWCVYGKGEGGEERAALGHT